MVELFDFFPFDMDPGLGFAGVFLLISIGLMLIGERSVDASDPGIGEG